jgi:hypothetical protein
VQVLEDQYERPVPRERVQCLGDLAEHALPGGPTGAVLERLEALGVEQPRQLGEPGRRALRQRGDHHLSRGPGRHRRQRLEDRHERLADATVLDALPGRDERLGTGDRLAERVHDCRLPDSRLAAERHDLPVTPSRRGVRLVQPRELAFATHQRGRRGGDGRGRHRYRRHHRPRPQRLVLVQHLALELTGLGRGLQSELDQLAAQSAIRVEGLDLPAGPVQRRHQRAHRPFAKRIAAQQPPQLGHRVLLAPELDQRCGAPLDRLAPELVERRDLALREVGVREVGERRAAPERECLVEQCERIGGRALRNLGHEPPGAL